MAEEWNTLINKFTALCDERVANASVLKREKSKVIMGYTCSFVPEEIAYAAGFIPFRLISGNIAIAEAEAHIPNIYCSLARTYLELGLKGAYDFLDGIIFPYSCDTMRTLYQIWKVNVPNEFNFYSFLDTRIVTDSEAEEYLVTELEELLRKFEMFSGDIICHDKLREAIKVYNESRQLMGLLQLLSQLYGPLLRDRW